MDNFSRLFYAYTDGKYDYLRVKNVDVNTETKIANVYIYVREDKYDDFDNEVTKALRSFFREIVHDYSFHFHYERLLLSEDLVTRHVSEYVAINFPFIAANVSLDSVEVEVRDTIGVVLYMPDSIREYAVECGFAKALEDDLKDSFITTAHVSIEPTDLVIEEEDVAENSHLYTAVPVGDIAYFCGVKSEYSRMPTMISYVRQPAERTAICGELTDMRCKEFTPEPENTSPQPGEKKRRFYKYHYTFNLSDGTDSMRVLFNTNDEKCPLAGITDGQFMVRGRVFYNERTEAYNIAAKTIYRCVIDKERLNDMLKPLPTPERYRLEPAEFHEEPKPVQLTLGLDDEEPRVKRLAGVHVFLCMRSVGRDKVAPYEIAALRTVKGEPTLMYHSYVHTADLLEIEASIKSAVAIAPRISDILPDLVKFFDGATVVTLQLERTQRYLNEIAKALRYVFMCEWTDGDVLLKKGKETMSFAKACRAHGVSIDGEGAEKTAHALFELYLSEKGVAQA